jgi:hypothetical protein
MLCNLFQINLNKDYPYLLLFGRPAVGFRFGGFREYAEYIKRATEETRHCRINKSGTAVTAVPDLFPAIPIAIIKVRSTTDSI